MDQQDRQVQDAAWLSQIVHQSNRSTTTSLNQSTQRLTSFWMSAIVLGGCRSDADLPYTCTVTGIQTFMTFVNIYLPTCENSLPIGKLQSAIDFCSQPKGTWHITSKFASFSKPSGRICRSRNIQNNQIKKIKTGTGKSMHTLKMTKWLIIAHISSGHVSKLIIFVKCWNIFTPSRTREVS